MPNENTQEQEKTDDQLVRQVHKTGEGYRLARLTVITCGVVASLYVGVALPIKYTAGQETVLHIFYRAVIDLKLAVILPYAVAVLSTILWLRERNLRKYSVRREHQRIAELEKSKDSNRSSSGFEE